MIESFFAAIFLLTILFTLLVWLKKPIYRLDSGNLEKLFTLVLNDQASENDWNVFVEFPIRYQPELEALRLRCCELTERHGKYRRGQFQLTDEGKDELREEIKSLGLVD